MTTEAQPASCKSTTGRLSKAEKDESALNFWSRSRFPAERLVYRPNRFVAWRDRREKSLQSLQSLPVGGPGSGSFLRVSPHVATIAFRRLSRLNPLTAQSLRPKRLTKRLAFSGLGLGLLSTRYSLSPLR
jgi:hypothetical protein